MKLKFVLEVKSDEYPQYNGTYELTPEEAEALRASRMSKGPAEFEAATMDWLDINGDEIKARGNWKPPGPPRALRGPQPRRLR